MGKLKIKQGEEKFCIKKQGEEISLSEEVKKGQKRVNKRKRREEKKL